MRELTACGDKSSNYAGMVAVLTASYDPMLKRIRIFLDLKETPTKLTAFPLRKAAVNTFD